MSDSLLLATSAFVVTLLLLLALTPLAKRVGLIDEPDHRKPHKGRIPLVGGLAIFLCFVVHVILSAGRPPRTSGSRRGSSRPSCSGPRCW